MTRLASRGAPTDKRSTVATAATSSGASDTPRIRNTGRRCSPPSARPISEAEFQKQVTDLAELLGYSWVHFRPAQTAKGWRTPVSGTLGKGWVDLVLVRPRDRRLIFAELKADKGKCSVEQLEVHDTLLRAGQHVETWRPSDFDRIAEILR